MDSVNTPSLDREITRCKQQLEQLGQARLAWDEITQQLSVKQADLFALQQAVQHEFADLVEIEEVSLGKLLRTLAGKQAEMMAKERQEFLAVKERHDELAAEVADMRQHVEKLGASARKYSAAAERYAELLQRKESAIAANPGARGQQLLRLKEAANVARETLSHVGEALHYVPRVKRGLDMILAGLQRSGPVVLGRAAPVEQEVMLDRASKQSHEARHNLRQFIAELHHIELANEMTQSLGAFRTLGDYFEHGLVTDALMFSQVAATLQVLEEVKLKVDEIGSLLTNLQTELTRKLADLAAQREALLLAP